jgi:hypothetical protein
MAFPDDAQRGDSLHAITEYESHPLTCSKWKDNADLHFVGNVGSTAGAGTTCDRFEKYKTAQGANRGQMVKVKRSSIVQRYQETFGMVDNFNQARPTGGSVENIPTRKWPLRCYNGLWNMAQTCGRKGEAMFTGKAERKRDWQRAYSRDLIAIGFAKLGKALDWEEEGLSTSAKEDATLQALLVAHKLQKVPDDRAPTAKKRKIGTDRNPEYKTRAVKHCHMCCAQTGKSTDTACQCSCGLGLCNPIETGRNCYYQHLESGEGRGGFCAQGQVDLCCSTSSCSIRPCCMLHRLNH